MDIKKTVETLVAAVTSTDVATIEGELTKLERRRAQLAESLDAATHSAIDASAVRRELIISNRDRDALEEASAKVRDAEERRVALDDALRTIGQQISELTARFEEAKDKAERDRVAQALEQEADKVETASLVLDKAAMQFASAYRQLRSAMSPASCLRTLKEPLREDEVARLVAAEALAGAVPGLFAEERGEVAVISVLRRGLSIGDGAVLFESVRDPKEWEYAPGARKHAEVLITTRLREKATAIRAGDEPPVLPSAPPEPSRHIPKPPQRHVLFLRPVRYTRGSRPVLYTAWTAHVPVPVAEAAIRQGLALDADTDEAREKMREMSEQRRRIPQRLGPAVTIDDTVDLGVDLTEEQLFGVA
jgi:hypothetical protein